MTTSTKLQANKTKEIPLIPFLHDHLAQLRELEESTSGNLRDVTMRIEQITEKFRGPIVAEGATIGERPIFEVKTVGDYIGCLGKHVTGMDRDASVGFAELQQAIQRLEEQISDTTVARVG